MNTHNISAKSSALALALAALLVGSSQISAAGQHTLLWAEHFKDAYKAPGERSQVVFRTPCSEADAKQSAVPIWAGHFNDAYTPSAQRTEFASVATRGSLHSASPLRDAATPC